MSRPSDARPVVSPDPGPAWLLPAVILTLPWLLLWPAPLVFTTDLLSSPLEETVQHLWGLWAAWQAGDPILVDTDRISWPTGFRFVLIDPGNLPAFSLGMALGPAAAFNTILITGVMGMGVAGALATRALGGDRGARALGAVAAMCCPALLSNAGEGITESFSVFWVGVAVAALVLHVGDRRPGALGWTWGALSAAAIGMSVWGGPYNGLWVALACGAVGVAHLRQWRRTVPVGVAGALLAAPVGWAIVMHRTDGLPGTASRQQWLRPVLDASVWRGGNLSGADALDWIVPGPLTGGYTDSGHSAYLGVVAVTLAVVAVARDRSRWPWLAGAVGFALVSLGLYVTVRGELVAVGDGYLLAPMGALAKVAPPLLRFTRWYRAAAVAGLLLAPLVAVALGRGRVVVGALLVADACLLAPRAWPIVHFDARPSPVWAALDGEGAVVELPPVQWSFVPEGGVRDENLLQQTWHGRANSGTFFNLSGGAANSTEVTALFRLAMGQGAAKDAPLRLAGMGYRWLVVDRTRFDRLDEGALEAALGPPVVRDGHYLVYALPEATERVEPRFPPWHSPVPPPGGERPKGHVGPGGHRQ